MEENVKTLSVRQLATLFDRSEQTVRRWKDKGINGVRLQSGVDQWQNDSTAEDEARGGSLVFTVESVRAFVERNPGLLDKAAPELDLILYGKKRGIFSRKRMIREISADTMLDCDADETGEQTQLSDAVPGMGSRAIVSGDNDYVLQLLRRRREEVEKELNLLNQELERIDREEAAILGLLTADQD